MPRRQLKDYSRANWKEYKNEQQTKDGTRIYKDHYKLKKLFLVYNQCKDITLIILLTNEVDQ